MPAPVVKKWAKEKKVSVKKADNKFKKAEELADEAVKKKKIPKSSKWAYAMGIFKRMMGEAINESTDLKFSSIVRIINED